MVEDIVCVVCNEPFASMEAAAAHMKKEHPEEFSSPAVIEKSQPKGEGAIDETHRGESTQKGAALEQATPGNNPFSMVPPGMLELLDQRVATKIQAAIEAERPQIALAVKGAIETVISQARAAGIPVPGVASPGAPPGGIMVPPVTSEGMALIQMMMQQNQGSGLEGFIAQANQFKAIGALFSPPPSLADRIITSAYIKNLKKLGLVTDKASNALDKELFGDVED